MKNQILSMASNYSGINKDLFFQVDEKLRGYHLIKRLMKSANKDDIVEPTDKSFISDVNLYNIQAKIIKGACQAAILHYHWKMCQITCCVTMTTP